MMSSIYVIVKTINISRPVLGIFTHIMAVSVVIVTAVIAMMDRR